MPHCTDSPRIPHYERATEKPFGVMTAVRTRCLAPLQAKSLARAGRRRAEAAGRENVHVSMGRSELRDTFARSPRRLLPHFVTPITRCSMPGSEFEDPFALAPAALRRHPGVRSLLRLKRIESSRKEASKNCSSFESVSTGDLGC